MNREFLHISDYSCGYPAFRIKDINVKITRGSFVGIIGPNGSGKTTLFRGITQILPALQGEIFLNRKELRGMSPRERARQIAIVNQFTDTARIRVRDYVLMGRIPYQTTFSIFESEEDQRTAARFMSLTGIGDLGHKFLDELSGGEKQRASIARALTQEPELLLLDEPTAHLDIAQQVRILDLLHGLNKEMGLTVLMVIHDLNLASEYCEKLILIHEGRIFTQGTPEQVLNFKTIEHVYQTPVVTRINPYSGRPVVFLVSGKVLNK